MLLWCTKRSFDPSSGVMKPYPFASLNHLTVPLAMKKHLPYCYERVRKALRPNRTRSRLQASVAAIRPDPLKRSPAGALSAGASSLACSHSDGDYPSKRRSTRQAVGPAKPNECETGMLIVVWAGFVWDVGAAASGIGSVAA